MKSAKPYPPAKLRLLLRLLRCLMGGLCRNPMVLKLSKKGSNTLMISIKKVIDGIYAW